MPSIHRWGHEFKKDTVGLGFLPWAHIFGQTCELHTQFAVGSSLAIVEKREYILEGACVRVYAWVGGWVGGLLLFLLLIIPFHVCVIPSPSINPLAP